MHLLFISPDFEVRIVDISSETGSINLKFSYQRALTLFPHMNVFNELCLNYVSRL